MKNIFNKIMDSLREFSPMAVFALSVFVLSGCEDFLDVSPKSQLEEDKMLSVESGYRDLLTGVYTIMQNSSMYGMNMTFGFAEVLSQNYSIDAKSNTWKYVRDFDYTNNGVETTIRSIWQNTYRCIANLNVLIANIEKADKKIFVEYSDSLYLGEAIGLRAFLHFELMRYFACAPVMDKNANGVPYVTEYSTKIVGQKSVAETMNLIIEDLLRAEKLLQIDPANVYRAGFRQAKAEERGPNFNINACFATLARVYLWNGDKENALKYANKIVAVCDPVLAAEEDITRPSTPFRWVHYTAFTSGNKVNYDPAFNCEQVFYTVVNNWQEGGSRYFHEVMGTDALSPNYNLSNEIYELDGGLGADYRLVYGFEQDGASRYLSKFWYVEGRAGTNRLPLLRMTESYLIAAECLMNSNPEMAIALLNAIRENRGLSANLLTNDLSTSQIDNEIYKEYRKEFLGEGQMFFYYKRRNQTTLPGTSINADRKVYVMPIPTNDKDFGGYSN